MSLVELFILAVGLSMDAFAVSICKGLSLGKITKKHMAVAGAWFGGFQALMPLIGYFLGSFFADMITKYAHWIAFVLLIIIGGNMLKEAMGEDEKIGSIFGSKYRSKAEFCGGVILILIGLKILLNGLGIM